MHVGCHNCRELYFPRGVLAHKNMKASEARRGIPIRATSAARSDRLTGTASHLAFIAARPARGPGACQSLRTLDDHTRAKMQVLAQAFVVVRPTQHSVQTRSPLRDLPHRDHHRCGAERLH
jgi:hypothetical protein